MAMAAHLHIVWLVVALVAVGGAHVHAKPPSVTIRGYSHLRLGNNITDATEVAVVPGVNGQLTQPSFGTGVVVADPFRVTADGASDLVGRVYGFLFGVDRVNGIGHSSLYLTFLISYKNVTGSILVQGTSIRTDSVRRFGVVGGTGDFELARGTATQTPVSTTTATDGSGAVISINEWRMTLYKEAVGPDLQALQSKLPELLV